MFSALLALALIAVACGGDDAALVPTATLGTAPPTTSTTARPIDVSTIPGDPAEIDEAYVQAVVDALFAVDAQATKIFVETKTLDEEGVDYPSHLHRRRGRSPGVHLVPEFGAGA